MPPKLLLIVGAVFGVVAVVVEWGRRGDKYDRDVQLRKLADANRSTQVKRRKPEWDRRLMAYWRRGNQILNQRSEAK